MTQPAAYSDQWTAALQAALGAGVDLDDAAVRWQRYTDAADPDPLRATILEVLRQRLATFVSAPATFNVEGDYSQSTGANITALQAQIAALATDTDGDGTPDLPVLTQAAWRETRQRPRTRRLGCW